MNLQEYIQQNPIATLQDVNGYSITSQRMISNKTQALYLDMVGLYLLIHEVSQGKRDIEDLDEDGNPNGLYSDHPAKSACLLIVNTLADGSSDNNDFNFMVGNLIGDGVIAKTEHMRDVTLSDHSSQIQALLDLCIAHCNVVTYPFRDVTQVQFNMAKGVYTSQQITHIAGKDIAVTLNAELPERVAATLWRVESGFNAENAGRSVYVDAVNKYRIDMSGKKAGNYEVRIPFTDADFTVGLV